MLPAPSGISVKNVDSVRKCSTGRSGRSKGKCFIGVTNRNVSTDDGRHLIVGNPSNKIENRVGEVGVRAIPMIATVKTFVSSYRFIKTDALLIGFAGFVSSPRSFVCLRNNDSSFL